MNWKEIGLRLMWTVIAVGAGALTLDKIPSLEEMQVVGVVMLTAGYNFVLLLIRSEAAKVLTKPVTTDANKS